MPYEFNKERALAVIPKLVESLRNKTYIFSSAGLPDERIPEEIEKGSREHANFLMNFCALTARVPSNELYDAYARFHLYHKDFIDSYPESRLCNALQDELHMGLARKRAGELVRRRAVIKNSYDNDPRNIFARFPEPREAVRAMAKGKDKLPGFAYKTAALFTQYAHKYRFASFEDPKRLLPAIDTHKIRIFNTVGILDYDSGGKAPSSVRRLLTEDFAIELSDFCAENYLDILALDEAVWILGAEICKKNNIASCANACPIMEECSHEYKKERGAEIASSVVNNKSQMNLFRQDKKLTILKQ